MRRIWNIGREHTDSHGWPLSESGGDRQLLAECVSSKGTPLTRHWRSGGGRSECLRLPTSRPLPPPRTRMVQQRHAHENRSTKALPPSFRIILALARGPRASRMRLRHRCRGCGIRKCDRRQHYRERGRYHCRRRCRWRGRSRRRK